MKALTAVFALLAIIVLVVISADLFTREQFTLCYGIMIVWISSIILWVKFAAPIVSNLILSTKVSKA